MSCLCGDEGEGGGDSGDWRHGSVTTYYWSPNIAAATLTTRSFGVSFRRGWQELEGGVGEPRVVGLSPPVPPGLYSCYLEATAGRAPHHDLASCSSGTVSSGISSWPDAAQRSRSPSSSRGTPPRCRSPSQPRRRTSSAAPNKPPRRSRHRSLEPTAASRRGGTDPSPQSSSGCETLGRSSRSRGRHAGEGVARAHSLGRLSLSRPHPRPPARSRRPSAALSTVRVTILCSPSSPVRYCCEPAGRGVTPRAICCSSDTFII